jgi:large subunit ribosomal protein L4e
VLSDAAESITKTSKAVEVLKKIGAYADVEKAKDSKAIRAGKGRRAWGKLKREMQAPSCCC